MRKNYLLAISTAAIVFYSILVSIFMSNYSFIYISLINSTKDDLVDLPPSFEADVGHDTAIIGSRNFSLKKIIDPALKFFFENGKITDSISKVKKNKNVQNTEFPIIGLADLTLNIKSFRTHINVRTIAKLGNYYYFSAMISSKNDLIWLEKDSSIISVLSNYKKVNSHSGSSDNLISSAQGGFSDTSYRDFFNLDFINDDLGFKGDNVVISVHDTGVDFGMISLQSSMHVDNKGIPTSFDPSGTGIGLIPVIRNLTNGVYSVNNNIFMELNNTDPIVWVGTAHQVSKLSEFNLKLENWNITSVPSISGNYRFGVLILGDFTLGRPVRELPLQFFFCLLTDTVVAGEYNTLYIDYETSLNQTIEYWSQYISIPVSISADWDFSNNNPHHWDDGTQILTADLVNQTGHPVPDGYPDISAGALANVADLFGVGKSFGLESLIVPGIDPNGTCIGVMAPSYSWHGSAVAQTIAGRNITGWTVLDNTLTQQIVENDSKSFFIGISPESEIMAITGVDVISDLEGWLWSSGFDLNDSGFWKYSGSHQSAIDVNSWGLPFADYLEYFNGFNIYDRFIDLLSVPKSIAEDYAGKLFISSLGNNGDGQGTLSSPSGSPCMLSVGGSTYYQNSKVFGPEGYSYDQIYHFSSKGVNSFGYPKPDVLAPASLSFSPFPISLGFMIGSNAWSMWEGTSLSSAIVAGISSLIMNANDSLRPDEIKIILKSTADDIGLDFLSQGSGRVNVTRAINCAIGNYTDYRTNESIFRVFSSEPYKKSREIYKGALDSITEYRDLLSKENSGDNYFFDTAIFEGAALLGNSYQSSMSILGEKWSNCEINFTYYHKHVSTRFSGLIDDSITSIKLSDLFNVTLSNIWNNSDFVKVRLIIDFNKFSSRLNKGQALPSIAIIDWNDSVDKNSINWFSDNDSYYDILRPIGFNLKTSNILEIEVARPKNSFMFQPLLIIYDQGFNQGDPLNYTLDISFFSDKNWNWFKIDGFNDSQLNFSFTIPDNVSTGIYGGFLEISGNGSYVKIPVCINIVEQMKKGYLKNEWRPSSTDFAVDNRLDYWNPPDYSLTSGKRLSGHWKVLTYNVTDENASAIACNVEWENSATTVDLFIVGPSGKVINTSNIIYLYGGTYNSTPTSSTQNFIITPINETGVYRFILHLVTLYGNMEEEIVVTSCYLNAMPSAQPKISSTDGSSVSGFVYGPHANLSVTWRSVNFSEIPSLNFTETTFSLLSGFELVFEGTITEEEAIPSYSIDYWLEVNLSAGQLVKLTGSFEAADFDFYVFAPSSPLGPQNPPTSQNKALAEDLIQGNMVEAVNPEKGYFITPENGTYKIGIDAFMGHGSFKLVVSTLIGLTTSSRNNSLTIDTHQLGKNGNFTLKTIIKTNSNLIFEYQQKVSITNFFPPEVTIKFPRENDKFYNEINERLRDIIKCSWITEDKNNADEVITNELSISTDGGGNWTEIASVKGVGDLEYDFDPVNVSLGENCLLRVVVTDNSIYNFKSTAVSATFTITRRGGLQISYVNILELLIYVSIISLVQRKLKLKMVRYRSN